MGTDILQNIDSKPRISSLLLQCWFLTSPDIDRLQYNRHCPQTTLQLTQHILHLQASIRNDYHSLRLHGRLVCCPLPFARRFADSPRGVPDISPYVTKLIYYMKMAKIPYEYHNQDLTQLDVQAPFGKLPYIIDSDDNTKVADSNTIIEYLKKKFGDTLDGDLSQTDRAISVAFDRLVCEHLYWAGIIESRWRMDAGFEDYVPVLVSNAEVGPELRKFLEAFRARILAGFDGQGMGRRDSATVLQFYKTDIDTLSDFIGDKKYMLGDKPHTVDASVYAILRHLVDQVQKWPGTGYIEANKTLTGYMERLRKEYDM